MFLIQILCKVSTLLLLLLNKIAFDLFIPIASTLCTAG
jgi:hypothetical protein